MSPRSTKKRRLQPSFNSATGEAVGTLNPHAPEFVHSSPSPLKSQANTGLSSATRLADEHKDCTAVKNTLRNLQTCRESSPVEYTSSNKETGCEPKATFWERMELRLSKLPPEAPLLMATQLSAYGLEQISGTKLNVKNHCLTARD